MTRSILKSDFRPKIFRKFASKMVQIIARPKSSGGPLVRLSSGANICLVGLGTYKTAGSQPLVDAAIDAALRFGYRHFDTAKLYANERELGNAFEKFLPKNGLKREDVVICTKFWPTPAEQAALKVPELIEESLANFKTSYLDLVLIHYPKPGALSVENNLDAEGNLAARRECWKALEQIPKEKVRSIGVSNYEVRHLEEMKEYAKTMPAVNQLEYHPHFRRAAIRKYCDEHNIFFQAFASFARQNAELLNDPVVVELAQKYNTSPQQILLSFATSQDIGVVPKSSDPARIGSNFDCLDLKLSADDTRKLNGLNEKGNYVRNTPWLVL